MQAKARDIQSCKAVERGPISATVVSEIGATAKSGNAAKMARFVLVALLSLVIAFALGGCRDTDVLTQKIIDAPGVSEIDYSLDPVRTDSPESDEQDVPDSYEADSEEQDKDNQADQPEYQKEEPTTEQKADQQPYDRDVDANGQATKGGTADGTEGDASNPNSNNGAHGSATDEGDGNTTGAGDDGVPTEGDNEQEANEEEPESPRGRTIVINDLEPTDDPQPEDNSPSPDTGHEGGDNENTWNPAPNNEGNGTDDNSNDKGQTYADGTYDSIPSAKSIAAAGPYATIVQSLGGRGALAAAPQQWKDALPAAAYANGTELGDVTGISSWGDGSQMTDAAVRAIIDADVDCVLTSSTWNVMSQDQANALNAAGINVVQMPAIGTATTMDADISMCVDVIGELLKDAGTGIQFDAKSAAATWKSMHNSTLETCLSNNGGYTCVALGRNGATVENYIYQGESVTQSVYGRIQNISTNRVYTQYVDYQKPNGGFSGPYATLAGAVGSGISSFDLIDYYFQLAGAMQGSTVVSHKYSSDRRMMLDLAGANGPQDNYQRTIQNGNGLSTPFIIARTTAIAEALASDAVDNPESELKRDYDYKIYVMPSGMSGCWTDGSFESYLCAPWTYSIIRNHGTADADSFVNDFYSTFYRCGAADCVSGYGTEVSILCGD